MRNDGGMGEVQPLQRFTGRTEGEWRREKPEDRAVQPLQRFTPSHKDFFIPGENQKNTMNRNLSYHLTIKLFTAWLTVIIFISCSPLFAYTSEKTGHSIYCKATNAVVEKIDNDTVVLKLLAPNTNICLEKFRGTPGKIKLKCKNVYAPGSLFTPNNIDRSSRKSSPAGFPVTQKNTGNNDKYLPDTNHINGFQDPSDSIIDKNHSSIDPITGRRGNSGEQDKKPRFNVKSGNARIIWQKAGIAMLEVNMAGKREAKINLSTKFHTPNKFTFAVLGDPQGRFYFLKRFLEKVAEKDSSFLIILGDLVDEGTEMEYGKYLKTIAGSFFPIYHIPGNHDVSRGGRGRFLDYISPTDYSFDVGKFHFIMLDSSRWYLLDYQWDWLEQELKKHRNSLIFMHVPPFCPDGRFDKYTLTGEKQDKKFIDLMNKYGVRSVFSGHIHGYMDAERDGVNYYVSGGGGAYLHILGSEGGYYHFLLVDIDGENIKVKVVKLRE